MNQRWHVVLGLFLAVALLNTGLKFPQEQQQERPLAARQWQGLLSQMYLLYEVQSKRVSSWDRTGKNEDWLIIPAGQTRVLLAENGAGVIRHFYWAYIEQDEEGREALFRGIVLRAFWDASRKPSIEVPLGDFFGVSNGHVRPIRSLAFVANPGNEAEPATWGFNCYLPMPFQAGARIELENQSSIDARIWFHIDYELHPNASAIPDNAGRLHAVWTRENPTKGVPFRHSPDPLDVKYRAELVNLTGEENFAILDTAADGQFVGVFLTVVNFQGDPWTWWGEGDDMIFVDGEGFPPSFHGTGSEEIFGGGATPAVEYTGPYTGFHCVENWGDEKWLGTNGLYRFYVNDPIRFRKSIRVTLEHGHGNNKKNDYCSVAFWYQQGTNQNLPPLAPLAERQINRSIGREKDSQR